MEDWMNKTPLPQLRTYKYMMFCSCGLHREINPIITASNSNEAEMMAIVKHDTMWLPFATELRCREIPLVFAID